jgi:hypothetical protein
MENREKDDVSRNDEPNDDSDFDRDTASRRRPEDDSSTEGEDLEPNPRRPDRYEMNH